MLSLPINYGTCALADIGGRRISHVNSKHNCILIDFKHVQGLLAWLYIAPHVSIRTSSSHTTFYFSPTRSFGVAPQRVAEYNEISTRYTGGLSVYKSGLYALREFIIDPQPKENPYGKQRKGV